LEEILLAEDFLPGTEDTLKEKYSSVFHILRAFGYDRLINH
jgi:hypothetical protein